MKSRKKLTVAALGFKGLEHYPTKHGQEAVDAMIEYLDFQLSFVLPSKPDIVVFPEACDRYPAHTADERFAYFDVRRDQVCDHLREVARKNSCYIAYSAARKHADGSYRNTTELIGRDGKSVAAYNKNHCVTTEISVRTIRCGKEAPVFETEFGRIAFAICFDLNFEELRLKYAAQSPDLVLFSSMYHGGLIQNYWAYSLGAYFVGAVCNEQCTVIDPLGEIVARSTNYSPYVITEINLDFQQVHLDFNWDKIKAAKDKYGAELVRTDRGHTGVIMLTSESNERTSLDVCREFDIELWSDYYKRSLDAQLANIEP